MANITQIELRNIKQLIEASDISYQKLSNYSSLAVDPQIKQMFKKAAQDAINVKQKLISFLNN